MRFLIDLLSIFAVPHITIQKDGHGGKERTDVIDGGSRRMKLIIDIPEEAKQAFDCAESNDLKGSYYDHGGVIGKAIQNGTPLDDLKETIEQDMSYDMFDDYGNKTRIHKELWEILDNIGKESEVKPNEK